MPAHLEMGSWGSVRAPHYWTCVEMWIRAQNFNKSLLDVRYLIGKRLPSHVRRAV